MTKPKKPTPIRLNVPQWFLAHYTLGHKGDKYDHD
jgi:hypothetical protein